MTCINRTSNILGWGSWYIDTGLVIFKAYRIMCTTIVYAATERTYQSTEYMCLFSMRLGSGRTKNVQTHNGHFLRKYEFF